MTSETAALAHALLARARDAPAPGDFSAAPGPLRADCVRLARKLSLLSHLFEEIDDFTSAAGAETGAAVGSSSSTTADPLHCLAGLMAAVEAAERFLMMARRTPEQDATAPDVSSKKTGIQLQYVTWQLEKVLGNFPLDYFNISDEVQEQVELVRAQLRRVNEKHKSLHLEYFSDVFHILSGMRTKEAKKRSLTRSGPLHVEKTSCINRNIEETVSLVAEISGKCEKDVEQIMFALQEKLRNTDATNLCNDMENSVKSHNLSQMSSEEAKKPDSVVIPEDFRCPISLELMRDPVIVATGQTYERSFIQRWIDSGHRTCPKTQQTLQNLTLTPNYVLRSLIMQWCEDHKFEQPHKPITGMIRRMDGSFREINGDRAAISSLIRNLSGGSLEERRSAAAEIRSLAKRSTDNRILIAEAGAIPALVNLLLVDDPKTQEHAVTSVLNLSIYNRNKEIIMMSGAIEPIIIVVRSGSMEARANAAAAIFSLSLLNENKITIGSTPGAIESLVELFQNGSPRGKKDAATALFNLCIYQGNKARAVKAGILTPLLAMLKECSSHFMVDEALTILTVLVSHRDCKVAIAKANMIPLLIDLLRTSQPRNKENAAAILLALCKKDGENLACLGRLGAAIPLTELAKTGTDRGKRKATSLLDLLSKLQMH